MQRVEERAEHHGLRPASLRLAVGAHLAHRRRDRRQLTPSVPRAVHAVRPGASRRVVVGEEVRGGRWLTIELREAEHVRQSKQRAGALP